MFVQIPDINRQISCGMRNLVFNQLHILEKASPHGFNPSLFINNEHGNRSSNTNEKGRAMQLTIRAVLAAKRFAKRVLERRRIIH
jgi:hypothetical protein